MSAIQQMMMWYWSVPLDPNLVAWYKLDGNANDSAGTNNGTPTSVTYTTGIVWDAAVFNGSSSKILITENTSLALTEFSINILINVPNITWFRTILRRSSNFFQGYSIFMVDSSIYWYIGNWADITTPAQAISASTWYMITLTWSNITKKVQLYINWWTPTETTTWTNIINSSVLNFGYDVPNLLYWAYTWDEVKIYNRVLTAGEISAQATAYWF